MRILILETSRKDSSILLLENGVIVRKKALEGGPLLSKFLAQEVKNLLQGQKPDRVAIGTGPGSYTGVRVGAALGQALAFGWGVPVVGIESGAEEELIDRALDAKEGKLQLLY
jgi:tRNA threonylcarbamoyladenosine biosynthesis protein TsaB